MDWFGPEYDGAIVFDECHRAKNCVPKEAERGRVTNESKTSRVRPEPSKLNCLRPCVPDPIPCLRPCVLDPRAWHMMPMRSKW